jgi:dipeptide transport system substrate-binding protein
MNADDVIFMLERQGKEDNPYFKVTSSNHSYYNDMGMAKLIKSIQKVDDYTVRITLNKPEAPFLSNLAMEYAGVQSKEYADAMMKAGTPEKVDQEPIGSGPFYLVQYQKDAVIRYKAFPQFWGGKAKIDDLVFSITPTRRCAGPSCRRASATSCRTRIRRTSTRSARIRTSRCSSSRASTSASSPTTRPRSRSTTCACARPINMAIDKKAIIDAVYLTTGVAAKNPIPPTQWSYNDSIKDDPFDPAAAKKLLAEAGYPNGFETGPVGHARAAAVQPERQAHRRAHAGRSCEDRRDRPRSRASSGASTASACRRASTRWACSDGPATTAIRTTSSRRCSAASPRRPTAATSPSSATSRTRT